MTITLLPVHLADGSQRIRLSAPYHPELPSKARAAGGKWDDVQKAWFFDPRDTDRVREISKRVYGVDPLATDPPELVTVRAKLGSRWSEDTIDASGASLWLFGREIVRRPGRDARVELGDGVVLIEGGFPSRGGSARHPDIAPDKGTIIEVRDVPFPLVEAARADHGRAIEDVDEPAAGGAQSIEQQILALAANLDAARRKSIAEQITRSDSGTGA